MNEEYVADVEVELHFEVRVGEEGLCVIVRDQRVATIPLENLYISLGMDENDSVEQSRKDALRDLDALRKRIEEWKW